MLAANDLYTLIARYIFIPRSLAILKWRKIPVRPNQYYGNDCYLD